MRIIAHSGYWKEKSEQNRPAAFERTLKLGFGIESDLRDCDGQVVIAHDPPTAGGQAFGAFLAFCNTLDPPAPLALNIKADGLLAWVREALESVAAQNAFVFDMSEPDTLGWIKAGVPIHIRQSEVEPEPVLYDRATGVCLDQFYSDWVGPDDIRGHLDAGKAVCLMSPELQPRAHHTQWDRLARTDLARCNGGMICTDFPEHARETDDV